MKGGLQINSPKIMVQVSLDRVDDARATYTEATKLCKDSIPLWLLLADLEVIVGKKVGLLSHVNCAVIIMITTQLVI